MPDVTAGYGRAFDLVDFLLFLQEGSYYSLRRSEIITDYASYQYTHFDVSTSQM